jgi:hypothetical protein
MNESIKGTIETIWRPIFGALEQGIQLLTPEYAKLQSLKNFDRLGMRGIYWPTELVNGGGMAWSVNRGSTARASSNEPVEATDTWKHLLGRFDVGFDELAAENDPKFTSAQIEKQLKYQAGDKLKSFRRAVSIGFYGFPDAILFRTAGVSVNAGGGIATIPLKDLYSLDGVFPKRIRDYLTAGRDYVAIISNPDSSPTIVTEGFVVSIDEANRTVDVEHEGVFAAGSENHALVLYNQVQNAGKTDLDEGMNGLLSLNLSGVVHGIDEDDYPDWTPGVRVLDYNKRLNGTDAYKFFEEIQQRSGYAPEWLLTTIEAIAAAGGPQLDQRRYAADDNTMRVGFKNLNVMGVIAQGVPYCVPGFAFIGNNSALRKLQPGGNDPGGVVSNGDQGVSGVASAFKQYPDTLSFYTDLIVRPQLTLRNRLAMGILGGVDETVPEPESE